MKHDIVVGNPPFQNNIKRGKTQHKLWVPFTEKVFSHWLKEDGYLGWVSPQSWGSPNNKVLNIFREKDVKYVNFDTKEYFPTVASTFSHYVIRNSDSNGAAKFVVGKNSFPQTIDSNTVWVPNILSMESFSIHNKVMFSKENKHSINYDYVTCHNVIRHAKVLIDKKISKETEKLTKDGTSKKDVDKICERIKELVEKRSKTKITISEVKTDEHIYPVFHTNVKTWYSSVEQDFARKKKVMWSRSGYTKPFYNNGSVEPLGCTDMGYFIYVDSDEEGKRLTSFLNSSLMKYIFKTAKWSGFGNERVFMSIPKIDLPNDFDDKFIYNSFGLTKGEVEHIEAVLNPVKKSKTGALADGETKSVRRVKEFGEVYTPSELVLDILNQIPESLWSDPAATALDPACGNGNFILGIIEKKVASGLTPIQAVSTTYGCDILADNVDECRKRVEKLLSKMNVSGEELREVLDKNIILGDSLEKDIFC